MERNSDLVAAGKFIHESAYARKKKEVPLEGIKLDFVQNGDTLEVHEVKKSPKLERAHRMQALYYLYVLRQKGVKAVAFLDYPSIRERKRVEFLPEDEAAVREAVAGIESVLAGKLPPVRERKRICFRCAYYELCWTE